jgi:hypothetical protein
MSVSGGAQRLRGRLPTIDPDAPAPIAPQPVAAPVVAPAETEPAEAGGAADRGKPPEASADSGEQPQRNALRGPGILPGRMGYRSFYVEDGAFARFRAAIYWLSRREDAEGVPENMSVAVQEWMAATAGDLEQRYNDGQVFRMPPAPKKRRAKAAQ